MDAWRMIGAGALAALSGMAGWGLHDGAAPEASGPQGGMPAARPQRAAADASPLIAVSDDGRVTLRVEQQPLEWVLEQLAQQTGRPRAAAPLMAAGGPAPAAKECSEPAAPDALAAPPAAQLLQALRAGSEQQRFDGLMLAREAGVPLDDGTLRALFEGDTSEQVRMRAFETFVESRAGSPEETRRALESALSAADPAIQGQARALLQQMHDYERAEAAAGPPEPGAEP